MDNDNKVLTFSLDFSEFSLDFDVWIGLSIEWTRRFASHGPNFVFAVADTWLRIGITRYLIAPEDNPGNFIETLKYLAATVRNPTHIPDIEKIIPRGGLYAWMCGYWDRIMNDCNMPDDEAIYDLLIRLDVVDAHEGNIAIYRYNGNPTIEVATNSEAGEPINVWCEFDLELKAFEVKRLQELITTTIQQRMK